MFGLTPYAIVLRVAIALAWTIASFGAGYLYKAHRYQVADAATQATQTTAQTTTDVAAKASDTVQIDTLRATIAANSSLTNTLLRRIAELSNANPAATTCRLPDGLRDQLNADFATTAR